MPQVFRKDLPREYDMFDVEKIARKAKVSSQRVLHVISKRGTTRYVKLAELVSALTGEPPETYLVAAAPKIDPIQPEQGYQIQRVPNDMQLKDFSDLELFQFLREVRLLANDIVGEMKRRLEAATPEVSPGP